MLTREDFALICQLKKEHPDFVYLFDKLQDENTKILSRISHDLRNVLTFLYSSSQLMEVMHPETADFKFWPGMISDIRFMQKFLEGLSTFNKAYQIHPDSFSLHTLLDDLKKTAQLSAMYPLITFSMFSDISENLFIGDSQALLPAMIHILNNALEAVETGDSIRITVTETTDGYEFCFADTGCGICESFLPTVMEPFITGKKSHPGLGLSISHKIFTAHNGSMSIHSKEGTGTDVLIFLPK